jgi:DNA polymerase III epsilon subunit-like protein
MVDIHDILIKIPIKNKIDKNLRILYFSKNEANVKLLEEYLNLKNISSISINENEYKMIEILQKLNIHLNINPIYNNNNNIKNIVDNMSSEQLSFILENIDMTMEKQEYQTFEQSIDGSSESVFHPNIDMNDEIDIINGKIILNIQEKTNCKYCIILLLQSFIVNIHECIIVNNKNKINYNIIFKSINYFKILNLIAYTTNQKIKNLRLVYDLETTGLIKKETYPEITQISIVDYYSSYPFYNDYVKIDGKLSYFITKLTGITNRMLAFSKTLDETRELLKNQFENIENCILIAHNGNHFDHPIMKHYNMLPETVLIEYLDSIDIAKESTLKFENHKQNTIYKTLFNEDIKNAHNAIYDVQALIKILKKLEN